MSGLVLLLLRLVAVFLLYLFLTWVIITIWGELRLRSQEIGARKIPALTLRPLGEDDLAPLRFGAAQVTIGRHPACDCAIDDTTVSAHHARLIYRNNQWWVEDLNSTNGTLLNGQRLITPIVLTSGDTLQFGKVKFSIGIGEDGKT